MTINKKKSRVLYRMTVTDPIETTEEVKEIDSETGEEIVRRKKVVRDQKIEVNFLSPTKKQEEASEFHYSIKLSELLKKGIVTKQMLLKQYQDTGGVFSNDTFRELANLYKDTTEFKNEYQKIASDNNPDRLEKLDSLNSKFLDAMSRIFEIEKEHESLFRNCADTMASNYKFRYFMLNGTVLKRENENDFSPLFFVPADKMGNIRFEDQIELFYELEEKEDPAYEKIREMMLLVYTYYFYGYASDEEKMTELIESYQKNKAVEKEMLEERYKEEVEKQISDIKEVIPEDIKEPIDEVKEAIDKEPLILEHKKKKSPRKKSNITTV